MDSAFQYIISRTIGSFLVAMIFGLAFLKSYELYQKGIKEHDRLKIWWSFTSFVFLFMMIIFLYTLKVPK